MGALSILRWLIVLLCLCGQLRVISSSLFQEKLDTPFWFVQSSKLSVWKGSQHVYPVGWEPVQHCLLLWVSPSPFPNFPSSLVDGQIGNIANQDASASKGPIRSVYKGLFVQYVSRDASSFQADRELGVCFHSISHLLVEESRSYYCQPVTSPKR